MTKNPDLESRMAADSFSTSSTSSTSRILLIAPSQVEGRAVLAGLGYTDSAPLEPWQCLMLNSHFFLLLSGVGKANASAALARELASKPTNYYELVICLGLAGSFERSLALGSVILANNHMMLDEGKISDKDESWLSLEEAGWGKVYFETSASKTDFSMISSIEALALRRGDFGTVSTISSTDEIRDEYLERHACATQNKSIKFVLIAETMESAAFCLVCQSLAIPYLELRIVSNYCGRRRAGDEDFPGALRALATLTAGLIAKVTESSL